jgi:hypothetical protein
MHVEETAEGREMSGALRARENRRVPLTSLTAACSEH